MMRKPVFVVTLLVVLLGFMLVVHQPYMMKASGTIYIRANGLVEGTDKITNENNVTYTFTDNIYDSIVVERSNIIIDGNEYALQSTTMVYESKGIELKGTENVTIQNMNVKDFGYGVFLNLASGSTISGGNITNSHVHGIWLHNSSNSIVIGNNVRDSGADGIALGYSDNNTISCNNITKNEDGIDMCGSSFNNTIHSNNITANSRYAIEIWHALNNTIRNNSITNNGYGLYSLSSSSNKAYGNKITNNEYGVYLYLSSRYTLSQNVMTNNKYNFYVYGSMLDLDTFMHSIDISNVIDEKPIYYLVNQQYLTIDSSNHPKVGYLALVNCTNIEVKNLTLTNNGQGVLLAYVKNSRIIHNNLSSNKHGIYIGTNSSNNTVYENTVTQSGYGITLDECSDNVITGNRITNSNWGLNLDFAFFNSITRNSITNNCYGLHFAISFDNRIYENNITDSTCGGMHMYASSNNRFYHNNFIHNSKQATLSASPYNIWNNSCEGNYWSDYIGNDANYDGIGDAPYGVDSYNIDHYPLMGMFSDFNATSECHVQTVCNSTISDFRFNGTAIVFNVTGDSGTTGFCRMCIPTALMNGTYKVFFNGTEVSYNLLPCSNATYSYLYFNYTHSTQEVIIIPEFPSFLILPLFMIATLLAVIIYKRKHSV